MQVLPSSLNAFYIKFTDIAKHVHKFIHLKVTPDTPFSNTVRRILQMLTYDLLAQATVRHDLVLLLLLLFTAWFVCFFCRIYNTGNLSHIIVDHCNVKMFVFFLEKEVVTND